MHPSEESHPALGIDYGEARVGIAATDALGLLAHPVESIPVAAVEPLERIGELIRERGVHTLVLGLPVRLDGTEGTSAAKVRAFGERLESRHPELPLVYVDEFLTTSIAQEKMRLSGRKAKRQRSVIDQAAAVEILNRWMGWE